MFFHRAHKYQESWTIYLHQPRSKVAKCRQFHSLSPSRQMKLLQKSVINRVQVLRNLRLSGQQTITSKWHVGSVNAWSADLHVAYFLAWIRWTWCSANGIVIGISSDYFGVPNWQNQNSPRQNSPVQIAPTTKLPRQNSPIRTLIGIVTTGLQSFSDENDASLLFNWNRSGIK